MAQVQIVLLPNTYRDSVFLMKLSAEAREASGAEQVSAMMGTPRNKELFAASGLGAPEVDAAGADDLVIAIKADAASMPKAEEAVKSLLAATPQLISHAEGTPAPRDLGEAVSGDPALNFAIISTAGDYARYEAARALASGMDVMLYSDNISLEDEVALKQLAEKKGLLVMGPDCGTAIIDGVPLAFANRVSRGPVGIVGASGTGLQEVTCLLDRLGVGISQAYGAGGRDLKDDVGGITAKSALRRLARDKKTEAVVLLGKPPGARTRAELAELLSALGKPVFVHYLGAENHDPEKAAGLHTASTLEELAVTVARHCNPRIDPGAALPAVPLPEKKTPGYLRGLFSGGTLCQEAAELAAPFLAGECRANIRVAGFSPVRAGEKSRGNCFWDFGEDEFTVGRPHPMMAPELRMERLTEELLDPEVSVVLMDLVLGYGTHRDQAGLFAKAVAKARAVDNAAVDAKHIVVYVCGTRGDSPGREEQAEEVRRAGAVTPPSNAQAALWAARVVKGARGGNHA